MPGLFDNSGPSGGILGGLTQTLFPGIYRQQVRDQAIQAYKNSGFSDSDAQLAVNNPQLFQNLWQQRFFQQQLHEQGGDNPNVPMGQALYNVQHPEIQYGLPQYGQPIKGENGMEVPTGIYHGQPFVGVPPGPNAPQPAQQMSSPQSARVPGNQSQAVPGPGGAATAGVPPALEQAQPYFDYFRNQKVQTEANVAKSKAEAAAQPDLPVLQSRAQDLIGRLEKIRDSEYLSDVVGGPLGIKGRTGPLGQHQSDLLGDIQDANNALQGDLFTSMRTVQGRPMSVGALKEMRITDLNARTGTAEAYKANINRTIGQIQNEYSAAWQARGAPDQYKPNWQTAASPSKPKVGEGWQFSQSRNQYRDPQGKIFNATEVEH